jgi:hypothetical protein
LIVFNSTETVISILRVLISPEYVLRVLSVLSIAVCICIVWVHAFLLLVGHNAILLSDLTRVLYSVEVLILDLIECVACTKNIFKIVIKILNIIIIIIENILLTLTHFLKLLTLIRDFGIILINITS